MIAWMNQGWLLRFSAGSWRSKWGERGGFRDEKGLRPRHWKGIVVTGYLGVRGRNWMESTFELRPAASSSDTSVGLRAKPRPVCVNSE